MILPVWIVLSRLATGTASKSLLLLALFCGLQSLPAWAESGAYVPYSGIIHGTEGADPVEVYVANATKAPLECQAALAHWYSEDLGRVAAGNELTLTLWHDSETGVLNLLNAGGDRMPVEAIWCASETARTRLKMPMAAGEPEAKLRFSCHAREHRQLSCDALDG